MFDFFFTITVVVVFFYEKPKAKQPALRDMLSHVQGLVKQ